jgi:hypothetical protein
MTKVFLQFKAAIREKKLPVVLCWEARDEAKWVVEVEERTSGGRFRISGTASTTFDEVWNALTKHINAYKC